MTKPARKSGANIPESQRSTIAVKLRMPLQIVEQLDSLCDDPRAPLTRSGYVATLIDKETNRLARRKPRA